MNAAEELLSGAEASVVAGLPGAICDQAKARGRYLVECFDEHGVKQWETEIENLVTTAGKNDLLDKYFAGSAYTAAWYMGLVDGGSTPTYNAADTIASHSGWTENVGYSNSTRPSVSWNAASAGSKATTSTSFSINAAGTLAGAFLVTNSTKSGTTGIMYSVGAFTGGSFTVQNGWTVNVTWTGTIT